jgi:methylthioribose-1-phosphate isomerase
MEAMIVSSNELRTIWWESSAICLIDQRVLPLRIETIRCTTVAETAQAITAMVVRGAPAIGCTAAYGMALAAFHSHASEQPAMLDSLREAKATLDAARPTAINLAWATSRMLRVAEEQGELAIPALCAALLNEAHTIWQQDLDMCHAIGMHGAALIPQRGQVLTHCNAGGLATAGYGTALAPIRSAHAAGRPVHVYVDETRPFMQGARLTAWELQQAGIPLTLITDSMAAYFMQQGAIDCIIVGADRIVANGDVANKIGTYGLAVLARAHGIPFYVAAPSSTIDLSLPDGTHIPIEQRNPAEVTSIAGVQIAPIGVVAAHPAFDVSPAHLISAIITERGVLYPPYRESLISI